MGYNTWTTNDLIDDVYLLGHVPEANPSFTASKILKLAQFEIQTPITKQILSSRGGYYLTYDEYTPNALGLYLIPEGAIAGALANIELVQDQVIIQVNELVESEQFCTTSPTSTSYGFFMKGNYVQILPIPNVGTPRIWYFKRTNNLVQPDQCAEVTGISSNVITVTGVPSTFAVGGLVDAIGDQPPFNNFGTFQITNISGSDVSLTGAVDGLALGDWLALKGQTCIPQIPVEYRLILAQRVVCKIYELQGYLEKLKAAQMKLAEYEQQTLSLVTPRVQSQTKMINPVNGGFLNSTYGRFFNFPAGRDL